MKMFCGVLLLYLCLGLFDAKAVDRFVTYEFPPYVFSENGAASGIIPEIVEAVGRQLGHPIPVDVVPWKRAQALVEASEGTIAAGPLVRTCDREFRYTWLSALPEISGEFVLLARDERFLALTDKDFKKLRVGLIKGTAFKADVEAAGFETIIEVETEVQSAKMLALGRTDLWASPKLVAERTVNELGHDWSHLHIAMTLADEVMFLVTSSSADQASVAAWRKAMTQIE